MFLVCVFCTCPSDFCPSVFTEGQLYVCQKHGKDVGSISFNENGKSDAMSPQAEVKTVSPDFEHLLHLPGRQGKDSI